MQVCLFFSVGQVGLACLDSLIHILIKQSMENTVKDLRILVCLFIDLLVYVIDYIIPLYFCS
jgi:hypothetical protein